MREEEAEGGGSGNRGQELFPKGAFLNTQWEDWSRVPEG